MNISHINIVMANELRAHIAAATTTISDCEGIAMILLWSFIEAHATCENIDAGMLAREQLEAFIEFAKHNIKITKCH
jgi:hypothetical protein